MFLESWQLGKLIWLRSQTVWAGCCFFWCVYLVSPTTRGPLAHIGGTELLTFVFLTAHSTVVCTQWESRVYLLMGCMIESLEKLLGGVPALRGKTRISTRKMWKPSSVSSFLPIALLPAGYPAHKLDEAAIFFITMPHNVLFFADNILSDWWSFLPTLPIKKATLTLQDPIQMPSLPWNLPRHNSLPCLWTFTVPCI